MASMGPRFCKRGNNNGTTAEIVPRLGLQWGHAFVSVETMNERIDLMERGELQWGHAFVSVETVTSLLRIIPQMFSFNGATLL